MHDKDVQRMMAFADIDPKKIGDINVPVLVVAGDRDVITVEHTIDLFRLFPKGSLAIFPGGHGYYMGEITTISKSSPNTLAFVEIVTSFILDQL
jgi:pimeloyl-ACP methyl ester carboxylesterase